MSSKNRSRWYLSTVGIGAFVGGDYFNLNIRS